MQLLARDLATGLGITGLIVSPAFGYAGVGFPILAMNAFASTWSAILPLRWYLAVLFGQAARGLPVRDSAEPFAMLAILAALYGLLALLRLRAISRTIARPAAESQPVVLAPSPGVAGAFTAEWRRVLAIRGAFSLLVLAPLIYGVYYPQPYLNQILRKVPIAVVDNDLTELSRRIVETLDASGAVEVAVRANTFAEARAALDRGKAFAVVGVPPGTERDVLKGTTVLLPVYADATYLFIFRSTATGIATAITTLSAELAARGARIESSLVQAKLAAVRPADILLQPVFNPVGGYASYIVPAAFVLILLGRGIAHLTIYSPALALYFIVLPRFYGFSTLGSPAQLLVLASLFIMATSFLGQAVGAWFKHPETPTLIFLGTSLPQFFTTGFAWPREAIPEPVRAAGMVFPADLAIDGIVRINQLGARLWDVVHVWGGLWLLAVVYFALAVTPAALVQRRRIDG
jgi:ABC-2 type transport system permease protein